MDFKDHLDDLQDIFQELEGKEDEIRNEVEELAKENAEIYALLDDLVDYLNSQEVVVTRKLADSMADLGIFVDWVEGEENSFVL
jgi:predicted nuclease with TOPRIM domain